jgi:hypothetical protein
MGNLEKTIQFSIDIPGFPTRILTGDPKILNFYKKTSKHHQIDPSLPLKQRAVSALHKYTLTDCYNYVRWLTAYISSELPATLPVGHTATTL